MNKVPDVSAGPIGDIETTFRFEVGGIGIPPRPAIVDQIRREMASDEPNFKHIGDVIRADVSISASLMKVVNSPYYGFSKVVRSVQEALIVLGIDVIARTVSGLAMQRAFANIASLERFWDSSACIARVSGWLAPQLKGPCRVKSDEAYSFGLFRDCGIPLLMVPFRDYPEILRLANADLERSFTDVEDNLLPINHAKAGAEMAKEWLFPDEFRHAIRYHHDLMAIADGGAVDIPEASRCFIAIALLAEYLIQRNAGMEPSNEWRRLGGAVLARLGLGEADLDSLCEGSRPAVAGD